MQLQRTFTLLPALLIALNSNIFGQAGEPETTSSNTTLDGHEKGVFFIAPNYQYAKYNSLKLISNTNHFEGEEGESTYAYTDKDITDYNNAFDTEFLNSKTALKIGYQVLDGLGVSATIGASHFNFKSWASGESEQNSTTQRPALTLGLALDYEKNVYEKFTIFSMLSTHYIGSKTIIVDNNSGEDVVSSNFRAFNWEFDVAMAYPVGKFTPYAGAGFTQMYVNSIHKEQTLTTDINGADFYNTMEFDAHYRESSFYGIAGLEYRLGKFVSVYGNSTFTNPLRVNGGIKLSL
jgi:hypothetical protein